MQAFKKINAFGHTTATNFYRALAHMTDAKAEVKLPVSSRFHCGLAHADQIAGSAARVS
jgi:hypothetical protein